MAAESRKKQNAPQNVKAGYAEHAVSTDVQRKFAVFRAQCLGLLPTMFGSIEPARQRQCIVGQSSRQTQFGLAGQQAGMCPSISLTLGTCLAGCAVTCDAGDIRLGIATPGKIRQFRPVLEVTLGLSGCGTCLAGYKALYLLPVSTCAAGHIWLAE